MTKNEAMKSKLKVNEVKEILKHYNDYIDVIIGLNDSDTLKKELIKFRANLRKTTPCWDDNEDIFYEIEAQTLIKYFELIKIDL